MRDLRVFKNIEEIMKSFLTFISFTGMVLVVLNGFLFPVSQLHLLFTYL